MQRSYHNGVSISNIGSDGICELDGWRLAVFCLFMQSIGGLEFEDLILDLLSGSVVHHAVLGGVQRSRDGSAGLVGSDNHPGASRSVQ